MKGKNTGKKVFILKRRVYAYIAAFVVALGALMFALATIDSTDEIGFYYSPSDNGAVVLSGDRVLRDVVPGKSVARVRYCEDKISGAVLMSDGSSYSLYYVTDKKVEKIVSDCTSDYVMSHDGSTVAYIATDGFLYRTVTSSMKTVRIDENVQKITISPDGSKLLYSKTENGVTKLCFASGNKTVYIADNYIPLAVSDDASLIYVLSADNALYLLGSDGAVRSKLCSAVDTGIFCFSEDISCVVFTDGSYTYMSETGKSKVRLIPGKATPVHITSVASLCNSAGNVYVYPDKKLTKMLYVNADGVQDYSLYFINKDFTRTDIASGVVTYTVTDNGVVYLGANSEIRSFKKKEDTLIANGAADMYASSDGRYIYYSTADGKLYSYHNSEATLLADGMEKMYMSYENRLYFIMNNSTLYSVKNGKRSDMIDENVYTCRCTDGAVYYSKNYSSRTGAFELYGSESGTRFRFMTDGLTRI